MYKFHACRANKNDIIFWLLQGAFYGIMVGHTCGVIRMVLDFVYPAPLCGEVDTRPLVVSQVHYTYFSQMNLVLTALVMVAVSFMTKPGKESQVHIHA